SRSSSKSSSPKSRSGISFRLRSSSRRSRVSLKVQPKSLTWRFKGKSEQIAKSNGFSTLDEFDDVAANISLVLAGLDPQSGQFTDPPDQIKKDIDELKQDKQVSQKDKDQTLAEMQEALKRAAPLQFKENVTVVKKYQKELDQVTPPEEAGKQGPG